MPQDYVAALTSLWGEVSVQADVEEMLVRESRAAQLATSRHLQSAQSNPQQGNPQQSSPQQSSQRAQRFKQRTEETRGGRKANTVFRRRASGALISGRGRAAAAGAGLYVFRPRARSGVQHHSRK